MEPLKCCTTALEWHFEREAVCITGKQESVNVGDGTSQIFQTNHGRLDKAESKVFLSVARGNVRESGDTRK